MEGEIPQSPARRRQSRRRARGAVRPRRAAPRRAACHDRRGGADPVLDAHVRARARRARGGAAHHLHAVSVAAIGTARPATRARAPMRAPCWLLTRRPSSPLTASGVRRGSARHFGVGARRRRLPRSDGPAHLDRRLRFVSLALLRTGARVEIELPPSRAAPVVPRREVLGRAAGDWRRPHVRRVEHVPRARSPRSRHAARADGPPRSTSDRSRRAARAAATAASRERTAPPTRDRRRTAPPPQQRVMGVLDGVARAAFGALSRGACAWKRTRR